MARGKVKSHWVKQIDKPLRNLVQLLRENGFNTSSSCGHLPRPYVQMEWYDDEEVTKLYNLLVENDYKNFTITAIWEAVKISIQRSRYMQVSFCVEMPLVKDLRE